MQSKADRYKRLAQAYVTLSDKFNELDVAHMALKQKFVPVVKALKKSQAQAQLLKQENERLAKTADTLSESADTLTAQKDALQQEMAALQAKYDAITELEVLLQPETDALLLEAEQQIELVEETLEEMSIDSDPDLSEADKKLLESCQVELQSVLAASDMLTEMIAAKSELTSELVSPAV